jgi:hypothetical protein
MARLFTVVFGPSRSKRFAKAVELARAGPGGCNEVGPGRYQARFRLGLDADIYSALGRLLERVRHWRATEVYDEDEQISVFHTKEMAWCASFYLSSFGECRERFGFGVLPRCGVCSLFDSERAIRTGMRDERAPAAISGSLGPTAGDVGGYTIVFGADLLGLLDRELPDWVDLSRLFPDFPPDEWPDSTDHQPAD